MGPAAGLDDPFQLRVSVVSGGSQLLPGYLGKLILKKKKNISLFPPKYDIQNVLNSPK